MLVVSQLSQAANFNDSPMIVASVIACAAMCTLIYFKRGSKQA